LIYLNYNIIETQVENIGTWTNWV